MRLATGWRAVGIAFVSLISLFTSRSFPQLNGPPEVDEFRYRSACGPIAIFVALKTFGIEIKFDDVLHGCNWIEGEATSLNELSNYINQRPEVSCRGVWMNMEQLKSYASSNRYVVIVVVQKNSNEFNHVLCVTNWNGKYFTTIDYPKLLQQNIDTEIRDRWNGQALIVSENLFHAVANNYLYFLPMCLFVLLFVFFWLRRQLSLNPS